jgi:hypothetical protein
MMSSPERSCRKVLKKALSFRVHFEAQPSTTTLRRGFVRLS